MPKPYYSLAMILDSVADDLRGSGDHSPTTIRCAINDRLDHAERDGYRVRHDYNQPRAVARVRRMLGK